MLQRQVLPSFSWVQVFFETLDSTEHISTKCQEKYTQWRDITSHRIPAQQNPQ
jgi:hypothetical protein